MLHRAWRLLPQGARRGALRHMSAALAPRPDRPAPIPHGGIARSGIAVGGELHRASGLGQAARLVLAGVRALGVPDWEAGGAVAPTGAPLVMVGNAPTLPSQLMRLGRARLRGRSVIGYWFWELPTVPPSWQAGVPFVHRVWAPSRFAADALAALVPEVTVVRLPVALAGEAPSQRGRTGFGLPEAAVVTLVMFSLASSFERKNPLAAIAAHRAAFGDRGDRILLMHVTNPHHFPADWARLREAAGSAGNIRLQSDELTRADTLALIAASDIVLSLHRSEGFGLVPAEAMRLGKPVVATDWSATTEFMDAETAVLVPARLIPARDPRGVFEAPGAVWADPDVEAAAVALRRLADDADERARLGAAAAAAIPLRLGVDTLADAVARLESRA